MSVVNLIDDDNEAKIATMAALVLRERFIEVAQSRTVMYVENDTVVRKTPNSVPIVIKHLSRRNPEVAKRVASRGTFKIRKRQMNVD